MYTTQREKPLSKKTKTDKKMVSYGIAKARAKAGRTDWNEREYIARAVITWVDSEYEYDLEVKNEERMCDEDFTAWVEKYATEFAEEDAAENRTTFEEIDSIKFDTDYLDDDEIFDEEYAAACEFEWECSTGR